MTDATPRPAGMRAFIIVWIGQLISILGTAVSNFALTLWAYEITGQATPLALIGVFFTAPLLVLSPVVGVWVDRGNRKVMMLLSDLAAAFTTLLVLAIHTTGNLQIWHLYLTALISGIFQGFQWPAYSATISTLLDKKHYARANAMLSMAGPASGIFAPMIAGALLGPLGLGGLLIIDLASAAFAISTLLCVHIPQPAASAAGAAARGSFLQESLFGARYVLERPSLLHLQTVFMLGNFFYSLAFSVQAPMLLARTGNNELIFGSTQSAAAIGGLAGGLVMGAWGGFKRRIHGVLLGWTMASILGVVLLGVGQTPAIWMAASFMGMLFVPLIDGSNQAIWQSKVAPDVQGRVFAIRRLVAWFVNPLANLLAGPLADNVFEPAMQADGAWVSVFGRLVGTGPGSGMGLMFVFAGLLAMSVALGGYLAPTVRTIETLLPDHDTAPQLKTESEMLPDPA